MPGEGEISALHVGLKGTRNALFLKDLAIKTHRGIRGCANRLNRERRQAEDATSRALAETTKAIAEIARVFKQGGWHRSLAQRMTELEMKQDGLTTCLSDAPQDTHGIDPNIAETYRRRIEAPAHPDDASEAADALREVIERVVVTLQGELGTILD